MADATLPATRESFGAWQDISTAPRNGKSFLAASGTWLTVCCWNKPRNDWCTIADTYPPYRPDEQPTHWMPFPPPPNEPVPTDSESGTQ